MNQPNTQDFLIKNVSTLNGVGAKIKKLLKKKNIEKISDLLWNFPLSYTDRSNLKTLDKLSGLGLIRRAPSRFVEDQCSISVRPRTPLFWFFK